MPPSCVGGEPGLSLIDKPGAGWVLRPSCFSGTEGTAKRRQDRLYTMGWLEHQRPGGGTPLFKKSRTPLPLFLSRTGSHPPACVWDWAGLVVGGRTRGRIGTGAVVNVLELKGH